MALSAAEVVDLRRFLGYPPVPPVIPDPPAQVLTAALSSALEAVVRAQLVALNAAEVALRAAYDGLDVKKAAVYERDLDEINRRVDHIRVLRMILAATLGIETGPWLGAGSFAPAVFVV